MAQFEYTALDAKGAETTGVIEAATEADALNQLRSNGYYPTKIGAAGAGAKGGKKKKSGAKAKGGAKAGKAGGRIKSKTLMIFTRQLATLIDSGLPLMRGLTVLGNQEPNPVLRATINNLADSVQTGATFSESLGGHPKIFNKLYVNMVKAGELGGVLELVLTRLADYQEKAEKLKNKIVSAMIYPVIVMFIAIAIVFFLMLFIVPKFEKIFEEMLPGKELPALTQAVMNLSQATVDYKWLILGGGALAVIGWKAWSASKGGRATIDSVKLKIPVFGDVQRKSAIARFTRTLGTLVTSGVPILQALNITRETAGNVVLSNAISKVHDAVKEGDSIVQPLEASKVFPPMVISMVDVGEETGQLPDMLLKVADVYDDEVDNAVGAMTSLIEPIMIVFLALIVGTIVLALFLPLIAIIEGMGQAA